MFFFSSLMFYLEFRSGLDAFQGCLSVGAVRTGIEFLQCRYCHSPGSCISSNSGSVYQIMGREGFFRTDCFASLHFTDNIYQFSSINSQLDRVYSLEFSLHCLPAWAFWGLGLLASCIGGFLSADFSVVGFWFFNARMLYKSWKCFTLAALFLAPLQQCIKYGNSSKIAVTFNFQHASSTSLNS